MKEIKDNFLPKEVFQQLKEYCIDKEFQQIKIGEKEFLILDTPIFVYGHLLIDGYEIILSFIRKAHKDFDRDWRIHADNIINGSKSNIASVLYIDSSDSYNGTAFWKHHQYGDSLPENITNEEFDSLLVNDANNLEKWKLTCIIPNYENRMLQYNSNNFHSKYPNIIKQGERIVLVTFYKKK
jgi:hypothetical protein